MEDKFSLNKKILTIVAGVNGVGKSSFTGAMESLGLDLGIVIDPDKMKKQYGNVGIKGFRESVKKINYLMDSGLSFTLETTLSGAGRSMLIQQAKQKGYFIKVYYIGLDSVEESVLRIRNRVSKGGHYISIEDVLRRYKSRFETLIPILKFCDEVSYLDNENGFRLVGKYENGIIQVTTNSDVPSWIDELTAQESCFSSNQ